MKVLICDDQDLIRNGLEMLLNLEVDIEVVGQACDGAEAVEKTGKCQPDVVLMDLKMPGMNGIEATRLIHSRWPNICVLVLTTYDDDEWVFDAIRAGAAGYLLKDMPREDVVRAVRGTAEGKSFVDPTVASKLLHHVAEQPCPMDTLITSKLTEREVNVLRLLAKGLSNTAIAAQLGVSEGTVRNRVSTILGKLEVSDRTQAAVIALQHGLGKELQ